MSGESAGMAPAPEQQISPELVLVDPVLRERLLHEALQELLYGRLDGAPAHAQAPPRVDPPLQQRRQVPIVAAPPAATPPHAGAGRRPPRRSRLPSLLAAAVLAMLFLALPSLAFLPPRQAPRLGAPESGSSTTVTWTVDPDADYYLLEVLSDGRLVGVSHPSSPPAAVGRLAPGTYAWRVFSGYGAVAAANTRGPIEAGTLVVEGAAA